MANYHAGHICYSWHFLSVDSLLFPPFRRQDKAALAIHAGIRSQGVISHCSTRSRPTISTVSHCCWLAAQHSCLWMDTPCGKAQYARITGSCRDSDNLFWTPISFVWILMHQVAFRIRWLRLTVLSVLVYQVGCYILQWKDNHYKTSLELNSVHTILLMCCLWHDQTALCPQGEEEQHTSACSNRLQVKRKHTILMFRNAAWFNF